MAEPRGFQGRHRLDPISFPLHEAVALCLLFQEAPPELVQSLKLEDVTYAFSAAEAYLRLRKAVAELFGDKEGVDLIAVERAGLDQVQESWHS